MAVAQKDHKVSIEQYLEILASDPEHKYEYIDGYITMMTGGTPNHSLICNNVGSILHNLLENQPCLTYNSDAYIQLSKNVRVCPDVSVSCDPRDHVATDIIRYPSVIVEVLSAGTEARDRGIKFAKYRACPSVQEYLLINPEYMEIELFRREKGIFWTYWVLGAEDQVELTSLGIRFSVADVYKKVHLPEPEPEAEQE
jgi:Uma2 family endonuclease